MKDFQKKITLNIIEEGTKDYIESKRERLSSGFKGTNRSGASRRKSKRAKFLRLFFGDPSPERASRSGVPDELRQHICSFVPEFHEFWYQEVALENRRKLHRKLAAVTEGKYRASRCPWSQCNRTQITASNMTQKRTSVVHVRLRSAGEKEFNKKMRDISWKIKQIRDERRRQIITVDSKKEKSGRWRTRKTSRTDTLSRDAARAYKEVNSS